MRAFVSIPLACLLLLACDADNDEGVTTIAGSTSGASSGTTQDDDASSSGVVAGSSGEDPGGSSSTGEGVEGTTSGFATSTGGSSTGEPPTSGPGVLPGESGQEAMCRRALECGSTYYGSAQACIDAGTNYWGTCVEVTAALDAFGACMSEVPCDDYNPDAYNPASTPCADQWGELQSAGPC